MCEPTEHDFSSRCDKKSGYLDGDSPLRCNLAIRTVRDGLLAHIVRESTYEDRSNEHRNTRTKEAIPNLGSCPVVPFLPNGGEGYVHAIQTGKLECSIERDDQMRRVLEEMHKLSKRWPGSLRDFRVRTRLRPELWYREPRLVRESRAITH